MSGAKTGRPYRDGVGIMLLNREGRIFAGRRGDMPGDSWQMPQGGIDPGEDPRDAAIRELAEETSVISAEILARSHDWLAYDLPADLADTVWGGRYRGQRQLWFAMRFSGAESEIDVATEDAEFVDWAWLTRDDLRHHIVAFKRPLYEAVFDEFSGLF